MVGGLLSGWLADSAGRRGALLYNNLVAFAAAALMALVQYIVLFCFELLLNICFQIFGLPHMLGTYDYWPLIFAFTVVPAFIQLATLPLCPESPKFTLAVRGQSDRAETDLKRLRGINDVRSTTELDIMREELASSGTEERPSMASMFRGSLRWPMTIAIMMMLSQQLSEVPYLFIVMVINNWSLECAWSIFVLRLHLFPDCIYSIYLEIRSRNKG
uniref:MFS domain-containing protein n=1 Tax=Heterorhabditis bacteriophora TaxID=37862 RepID=A0A1I7XIL6_HETBA